jgi:phage I-like protein
MKTLSPTNSGNFLLRAIALTGKAPDEIPLLPLGRWDGYVHPVTRKQMSFEVTPELVRAAVKHNTERKQINPDRDLVIDYEHATLSGNPAPAAGWIGSLRDGGDRGLIGTNVRWTDKARAHIEAGEYRYISPVFAFNAIDKKTGVSVPMAVYNAGLTNEPFLDELPPLVSKDQSLIYLFSKEDPMDPVTTFVLAFLAIAAGATPDQITAKANEFFVSLKGLGITAKDGATLTAQSVLDQVRAISLDAKAFKDNYAAVARALGADPKATPEQLIALAAKATDTSLFVSKADHEALLAKWADKEIDEIIAGALKLGKITPAVVEEMKLWAKKDLASFKAFLAKQADYSAVPLQQIKQDESAGSQITGKEPTVEAVRAYADFHKMSFRDAAIAMTAKHA